MNKMPYKIKQKLAQIHASALKTQMLTIQLNEMFDEYDIDTSRLDATCDCYEYKVFEEYTEALGSINNAEGNIEDNIADIERIFLKQIEEMKGEK